jgi:hypothetical protein
MDESHPDIFGVTLQDESILSSYLAILSIYASIKRVNILGCRVGIKSFNHDNRTTILFREQYLAPWHRDLSSLLLAHLSL